MEQTKKKILDFFDQRTRHSLLLTIVGTLIYSAAVVWLLNLGDFFAGGITGISQLISRFVWGKVTPIVGLFIGLINLPLFLFGTKGVSKKFAILTLISVGLQTVVVAFFQFVADAGFNPLKDFIGVVTENGVEFDSGARLLVAILGGAVSGYGISLCLKAGGSSGGMDVIANYLLVKKNISFAKYSFIVDLIIIACASIISIETSLFTIVRLICSSIVVANFYTSYRMMKLQIITSTDKMEALRTNILQRFHHGITIYDVVGGYTMEPRKMMEIVLSMYEVDEYINYIEKEDPKAFIEVSELKNLRGNYKKRTVV
ncbi:MAG: YitT family protein [Bacilli bacterium]|nr:YitT family protein [Bacilli bacterium]